MRPIAMMLFWLIHGFCHAQPGSLSSCMDQLTADPRFSLIARKLDLGTATQARPGMLADTSLASSKERPIISDWAAARGECIKADSRYGNEVYRPPLQAYGIGAENKVMAAAVALYNRQISFGEFNRRREMIAEELRGKAADLNRQIQSQRTTEEQANRQMREREALQREIDEAVRQATMARQEAELAQRAAVSQPTNSNRQSGLHRYQPPTALYRNCFRFGSRVTCTSY